MLPTYTNLTTLPTVKASQSDDELCEMGCRRQHDENSKQDDSHTTELDSNSEDDSEVKCKDNAQYRTNRGTRRSFQPPKDSKEENGKDGTEKVPKKVKDVKIPDL